MVPDPSGIAHSGSGYNYLRRLIKVNVFGFLTGNGKTKSRKIDGINPLFHQPACLIVIAFQHILLKHMGGFYRKGAVHINRKIIVAAYCAVRLDLTDEIKQFLGTAYCKGRNHNISAPI